MVNIFLTNLGKYNEGELIGEWLELPATQEEIDSCLQRIGISEEPDENGVYYEEYFITDYETDISGLEIGEYSNLEELNELAESLENIDADIVEALLYFGVEFEEITEKAEECMVYSECHDMTDVAIQYTEETGLLNSLPENLRYYFDFEAFGRDMDIEGNFYFTKSGDCIQFVA